VSAAMVVSAVIMVSVAMVVSVMTKDVSTTCLLVSTVSVATLEVSEASSLRFDAHATKPKSSVALESCVTRKGLTHILLLRLFEVHLIRTSMPGRLGCARIAPLARLVRSESA